MNKKVVVTGATGLVGSHLLISLVERSAEIIALYRTEKSIETVNSLFDYYNKSSLFKNVVWKKADVLDIDSLITLFQGISTVYHTAAFVSFEKKDAEKVYQTNVEGTKNVLQAIEVNKVPKLSFVSSVASIRLENQDGFLCSEGTIDSHREWTDYARSKMESEKLVLEAKSRGLHTVIVNPGVILGPGDKLKSSTVIFNTIKEGLSFYTLGINGFVDVRDVVDSIFKIEKIEKPRNRYVCVGANIQFKELFEIIAKSLNVAPPRFKANKLMLSFAWRSELVISKFLKRTPKITRDNSSSALSKMRYNSSYLIKDTGIEFRSMEVASKNAADFILSIEC